MFKIIILVIIAEAWTAAGQVLLKLNANALGEHDLGRAGTHLGFLREILTRPGIWGGFAAMTVGMVFWLVALAEGDLSLVFSLGSLQYLIILIASHFFLGEKIDWPKAVGTTLVIAGIVLIAVS